MREVLEVKEAEAQCKNISKYQMVCLTFFFFWNYFAQMALSISFVQIVEKESASLYEIFKPEFDKLLVGTLSLPINLPRTNYHHGFQVYC